MRGRGGSLTRDVSSNLAYGLVNNLSLRLGNLLLGVLLARLLAPEDFGVYAIALTVQAILANLTDLGLTAYLVRSDDPERRAPTVLSVGLAVGALLAAAMAALAGPLASLLGSADAAPLLRVLALTLVLSGAGSVPAALLQRRFQQSRQLTADATSFLVGAVVALALIGAGAGAVALAWSRLVGQVVAVALLFRFSGYRGGLGLDRAVLRDGYRFGMPLVGANVLSWVLLNMDYVLIARAAGATALGFYVLAFNISSWPTSAISQAVRAVSLPAFTRGRDGSVPGTEQVGAAAALAMAGAAPVAAVLAGLAGPLVVVVYGERWAAAALPLAALAAFGAVRPVFDVLATYLTARGATRSVLAVQLLWAVALVPALLVGIDRWGLAGAGLAHLAVGLAVVLPAYLVALSRVGVPPGAVLARLAAPTALALLPLAVAVGATRLPVTDVAALLTGGAVAGLAYLALAAPWLRRTVRRLRAAGSPPPGAAAPRPAAAVLPPPRGPQVVAAPLMRGLDRAYYWVTAPPPGRHGTRARAPRPIHHA
ncbi:MAG: oligosaccharide flippase family protein [Kineosporiaceae bacterium]